MTSFLQRLGSFSRGSNVSRSNSLKKAITTPDLRATDQTGQSPTDINYDVIEGEPQGDLQSSVFYDTLLVQETGDGCLIQQCQHCKESNVGGQNSANLRKANIDLKEENNALKLKNEVLMDMVVALQADLEAKQREESRY